jgi:hypothetical protein
MTRNPRLRSLLTSAVLLALAGGAVYLAVRTAPPTATAQLYERRLRERLPDADPALLARTADAFGETAEQVADRYGVAGLHVLDSFGAEAFFCWEHAPKAFADLVDFHEKHPDRVPIAVAWKRAIPEWAQATPESKGSEALFFPPSRLGPFLSILYQLSDGRLDVAHRVPAALPLLRKYNRRVPVTQEVLRKHGERAWRLILTVNHRMDHEGLERLAEAIREDDLLLDVNDQFGPALALMFVPPRTEEGSRAFPAVARHAWRTMGPEDAAAFLTTSYRPALDLLDEGQTVEDLTEAIDQLRALPELTRELALDHTNTLRLLTEEYRGRRPGVDALKRCGPEAADLLYGAYGSEPALKRPALVTLAGLGLQGMSVLERFRKYGPFFELLRRADRELLEGTPPLVLDAMARLAEAGGNAQQKIADYLRTPDLARSLAADRLPPPPAEDVLAFVPGYTAYRTALNYSEGRLVTGGDFAWAAADAADTALVVKGLITRAGKSVAARFGQHVAGKGAEMGTEAVLRSMKGVPRAGWEELAKRGLDGAGAVKQIDDLRKRFGDNTRRWPADAREQLRDLLIRTPGLSAAAAREAHLLARHAPLVSVLEQAAPVARTVGIQLWRPGTGPLVEREVFRDDSWRKVRPKELNYLQESNGVGEFAIAMLETGGHLPGWGGGRVPEDAATLRRFARRVGVIEPNDLWLKHLGLPPEAEVNTPVQPKTVSAWHVGWLGVAAVLGLLAVPPVRRSLLRRRAAAPGGHEPIRE